MGHWTEPYIGRAWVQDEYDCADLVRDVARDQMGLEVALPCERDWRRMTSERIRDMASCFVERTDDPKEYDGVLMRIRGSRLDLGGHIGVFAAVAGTGWVLHNLVRIGVIFTPVAHLHRLQLDLEGYYRWTDA